MVIRVVISSWAWKIVDSATRPSTVIACGGGVVDVDGDVMRGDVGDPPVEPDQQVPVGRAVGARQGDFVRRPVAVEAAADEKLVEAVEPAQAATVRQVDERRVDRPVEDRRGPADLGAPVSASPEAHPSSRGRSPSRVRHCPGGSGRRPRAGRPGGSAW